MSDTSDSIIRMTELTARKVHHFDLTLDAAGCATMAQSLDIAALRKFRLTGTLSPRGKHDWLLQAHLGASVVQNCVVTLDPVNTRIDEDLRRLYVAQWDIPEGAEIEMPQDTDTDPLPDILDLRDLACESLLLALPDFPRAQGAQLGETTVTEPGIAPLRDEDTKPFAGLAGLRDKLSKPEDPA